MIVDKTKVKTIPGFSNYAISREGKVWSKSRFSFQTQKLKGQWLKSGNRNGYLGVVLRKRNKSYSRDVHRLVLETYVGPCPEGMESRHLDGNSQNNNLNNLCWGTHSENMRDTVQHGTHVDNRGEKCGNSKLTERDVRMIIYMYRTGLFLVGEIAKQYRVSKSCIAGIINRRNWRHLWN